MIELYEAGRFPFDRLLGFYTLRQNNQASKHLSILRVVRARRNPAPIVRGRRFT